MEKLAAQSGSVVATVDEIPQRVGDEDSQTSVPYLPEDIWRHIHSLMPLDVAARAASLSHAFLSSWRSYPKLDLNWRELKANRGNLGDRVQTILRNHSGLGLRILRFLLLGKECCFPSIDSCLQLVAAKPGIEELTLWLHEEYNLPCSVLSDGVRNSVRTLELGSCTFRPVPELGPLRSLTRLTLDKVRITGEELEHLLSNSLALENLDIDDCKEIVLLKIPSVLQHLNHLHIFGCWNLQAIENKAPNLFNFRLIGELSKLSLGETLQIMKVLTLYRSNAGFYARTELPSIMPNLECLGLCSTTEVDIPMLPTKFLNLKHLAINITGGLSPSYDYFSFVSFLDASPSLETWYLNVFHDDVERESVFGCSLHLRQLPKHLKLRSVEIAGFKSAKILVELTCCIVKSAVSLEQLTLNTFDGCSRCSRENNCDCRHEMCYPIGKAVLEEASRAVVAIRSYVVNKIPQTVKLTVVEPCPCPRCRSTPADHCR